MENLIDIKDDKKTTIKSHLLINFSSDLMLEEDFSSKSKIDNKNQFIKMFSVSIIEKTKKKIKAPFNLL